MRVIRSPWLSPALLLMGFAGMFTFDSSGFAWFWAGQPQGAFILMVSSAVMWVMAFRDLGKRRDPREQS